jgi:hypothetical protein
MCHSQGLGCPRQEKVLTSEHTTLRRHAAAIHLVSTISLQLYKHYLYLCLSIATESGASQTSSTRCYLRTPSSASVLLRRANSQSSRIISAVKTQMQGRCHIATASLKLPPLSGSSKQIRYVHVFVSLPVLICIATANSVTWSSRIQENARCRIPSQTRYPFTIAQEIKVTHPQDV